MKREFHSFPASRVSRTTSACIAHLRLSVTHRRFIRTRNLLERLFLEERRRLKIIPNGFSEKPVLDFMLRALILAAERPVAELLLFNLRVGQSRLRRRFCDGVVGHVGWLIHRCQDIYGVDFRGDLTFDFHCRFPPRDL